MRGPAFSVLSEFRSRLVAGAMEAALLEALLARLGELGLVGAGMRQRTDTAHVLGRIRDLNRLELAGETVRAALAAAAPGWLAGVIDASWQEVYGQRIDGFRLPDSAAKRADLAVRYGRDGYHLRRQARDPGAPGWLAGVPAVQALRRVWIQQFCLDVSESGEKVIWRGAEQGLPPARSRLVSPYDLDVRYAEKRGKGWTGYKVHLSETCHEPDAAGRRPAPNLITNTETTLAPPNSRSISFDGGEDKPGKCRGIARTLPEVLSSKTAGQGPGSPGPEEPDTPTRPGLR